MKVTLFLFSLMISLMACHQPIINNEFIIEGNVKNIPDGKIYLSEAHYWNILLDSTECINGHFVFKRKIDSSFYPYMAKIMYRNNDSPWRFNTLFFKNEFNKPGQQQKFIDGFYLEPDITIIQGIDTGKTFKGAGSPVMVKAGKQNEILCSNYLANFGWIRSGDSAARKARIINYSKQIKDQPNAYFFLESLFNYRSEYSKDEIKNFLSFFDKEVQESALGNKIRTYLQTRIDPGVAYPDLLLVNPMGQREKIMDTTAKLNMLMFWASWCHPCRMEIPVLKKIKNEYKGKGLHLVNISIDDDRNNWELAMKQENMHWPQYIIDADKPEKISAIFNFNAIPLVVFIDKNRKEITRFAGYEEGGKEKYITVISKYLTDK